MEDHTDSEAVGRDAGAFGSVEDDPTAPITEFRHAYRFLSNFWPCRVFLAPHWYPSVEHAYQAAKCANKADALAIRNAPSAGMAKRLGSKVVLREDWEHIKLEVMADLLWQKFVLDSALRARLLATGDRELIEGNTWGDTFWGKCGQTGHNHLGRLIMRLRDIARYLADHQPPVVKSDGRQAPESAG